MQGEQIGIINYKLGQIVEEIYYSANVINKTREKGKIVYIHPFGRFYTVEYDFGHTKVRESYTVRSDINPVMLMNY